MAAKKVTDFVKSGLETDRVKIAGGEDFDCAKMKVIAPASEGGKGKWPKVYFDTVDGRKYYSVSGNLASDCKSLLEAMNKQRLVKADGTFIEPVHVHIYAGDSPMGTFYTLFEIQQ